MILWYQISSEYKLINLSVLTETGDPNSLWLKWELDNRGIFFLNLPWTQYAISDTR